MTSEVLLSGAVGALAVFVLGLLREWWREEREREGLLHLLLAEIDHNAEVERTIGEGTWDLLSSKEFPRVSTGTWRDVQGRAAALLPDDLFATLNRYYSALQTLLTLLKFEHVGAERMGREIKRKYGELKSKEVPASRNPWDEYLKATLDEQERARESIVGYFGRRWEDRLILRLRQWVDKRWQRGSRSDG